MDIFSNSMLYNIFKQFSFINLYKTWIENDENINKFINLIKKNIYNKFKIYIILFIVLYGLILILIIIIVIL